MSNEVFTVRPVAELLDVSPDTVRRWADTGVLPSYRLPSGHRRIDAAAVLTLRDQLRGRLTGDVARE